MKKITPNNSIILIAILVIIDQISKIYIKLNFPLNLYGTTPIIDWGFFKLLFVENQGMAMGAKLSDLIPFLSENLSKLFLTLIRLIAICAIGYWLKISFKNKVASPLFLFSLSLIFAGAFGNIIDSIFYGVLFSHSYGQIATFLPDEGGYASIFYGSV
ncbi:MAG: signal peptidase II, partial [Flavobacteriaceae bacterium]|nr:signal peptidase II [Flavobacteriaceae bacterium]